MKYIQVTLVVLLSFLAIGILGKTIDDETNKLYPVYPDMFPLPYADEFKILSDLPELKRSARHRPFLAGAAVGAVVANNRHPTYYSPSYYYPSTYYPSSGYSNGCNCNG